MNAPGISMVLLVGDDPEFSTVVAQAARLAFPAAALVPLAASDRAPERGAPGGELLALYAPDAARLAQARGALDEDGLPRWAVVVFGAAPDAATADSPYVLARGEWDAARVARVFRAAADGHALLRENARLRGDLATFGHRIAHDLRTPLGGVLTTAEMLTEILGEKSPGHAPLVRPIVDSAEGLVRLIDRMSFFAKAVASTEPPQRLDMGGPFWSAFQQLEGRLLKAGAALSHPREWPAVSGHRVWLEGVWRNLIANAIEHGGPAVRIEAGWTPAGPENRFWLRDNGRVPPEKRATLFFPFHRRHHHGAPHGLGLAIVERLVALDGGRCGFEERAEGGSEFYFILPAIDDLPGRRTGV